MYGNGNFQFNDQSFRSQQGRYFPQHSNGGSYGRKAGYNPNYQGTANYTAAYPKRKKSGAREKVGKNGKPCISAWKKSRNGFLTLIACPNNEANVMKKNGQPIINGKGQEYARWTGTMVERNTGAVSTHSCLYNTVTGKLYIPELNMVASPRANNGGFFGNSYVSKRR